MSNEITTSAAPGTLPTMPSLPASVRRLTTGNGRSRFSEDGEFLGVVDDWRLPAVVSPADLEDCRRSLAAVEEYLAPAQPHQLSGRIVSLLRHYFVPAVSGDADKAAALQRAVAHDWHEALGEFPAWAVMEACRKWINREERRPTPAAIRNECQKLCADQLRTRDRLRKIVRENEAKPAGGNVVPMPRLRRMTDAAE